MAKSTVQDDNEDVTIVLVGPLPEPDGETPSIRSVWQIDPLGDARFITAYPIREIRS